MNSKRLDEALVVLRESTPTRAEHLDDAGDAPLDLHRHDDPGARARRLGRRIVQDLARLFVDEVTGLGGLDVRVVVVEHERLAAADGATLDALPLWFERYRREGRRVEHLAIRPRCCARDELGIRIVVRNEQAVALDHSGYRRVDDVTDARQIQCQIERPTCFEQHVKSVVAAAQGLIRLDSGGDVPGHDLDIRLVVDADRGHAAFQGKLCAILVHADRLVQQPLTVVEALPALVLGGQGSLRDELVEMHSQELSARVAPNFFGPLVGLDNASVLVEQHDGIAGVPGEVLVVPRQGRPVPHPLCVAAKQGSLPAAPEQHDRKARNQDRRHADNAELHGVRTHRRVDLTLVHLGNDVPTGSGDRPVCKEHGYAPVVDAVPDASTAAHRDAGREIRPIEGQAVRERGVLPISQIAEEEDAVSAATR